MFKYMAGIFLKLPTDTLTVMDDNDDGNNNREGREERETVSTAGSSCHQ